MVMAVVVCGVVVVCCVGVSWLCRSCRRGWVVVLRAVVVVGGVVVVV